MKQLFYFIFLLLSINFSLSKVVIPFHIEKKLNNYENFNSTMFIEYVYNSLLTDIELGEPIQKIKTCISNNAYSFKFSDLKSTNSYYYNVSNSKSFINTTDKNQSYLKETSGVETFYFYTDFDYKNKIKIENFTISLTQSIFQSNIKYDFGVIGLQIYSGGLKNNFITELGDLKSKLNFIKNYSWQIKNVNKDNYDLWQLIIGEYPHEYDSKNFKEEILKNVLSSNGIYWKMNFRDIKSGDNSLSGDKEVDFQFNNIHMIAPEEYRSIIFEKFFLDYIDQNICFEEKLILRVIYCKKSLFTKKDIEKFPKLKFYEMNFNYTFEFDGNDLFIEKNEYYYFLVGLSKSWSFGLSFLKKYPLIFNHENKAIYYYAENKDENENENNNSIGKWIFAIVIGVIFLIIGLVVGKYFLNKKTKKKANELVDDDYDYKQQNENKLNNEGFNINENEKLGI